MSIKTCVKILAVFNNKFRSASRCIQPAILTKFIVFYTISHSLHNLASRKMCGSFLNKLQKYVKLPNTFDNIITFNELKFFC